MGLDILAEALIVAPSFCKAIEGGGEKDSLAA
jgi:hypothetical protein